jgi:hypothetical protein
MQSLFMMRRMELVWTWNKDSGILTAKLGYKALSYNLVDGDSKWWWPLIWKWKSPLKTQIFVEIL